jgi:hypothetical protein
MMTARGNRPGDCRPGFGLADGGAVGERCAPLGTMRQMVADTRFRSTCFIFPCLSRSLDFRTDGSANVQKHQAGRRLVVDVRNPGTE